MLALADLALLGIGGLFLTAGDIVFKYYAMEHKVMLYAGGIALYVVGLAFLVKTYETDNIAVASAVFVIANIITLTLVEWLWFHEPLSPYAIVGIVLAIAAIFFFEIS